MLSAPIITKESRKLTKRRLKLRVKTLHKQFRHFETFKCFGDLQFYFLRAFVKDSSQIVAIFRDRIKVSETYNFICSDVI